MAIQKMKREFYIMSVTELEGFDRSRLLDGSVAICVPSGTVYMLVHGEWVLFGGGV
ncbi:MAG: hypothetical protein MJY95_08450 [Bacteroidaceae bacterium]|nr:hypothetical protein [Bacteroidaceae bacterium]